MPCRQIARILCLVGLVALCHAETEESCLFQKKVSLSVDGDAAPINDKEDKTAELKGMEDPKIAKMFQARLDAVMSSSSEESKKQDGSEATDEATQMATDPNFKRPEKTIKDSGAGIIAMQKQFSVMDEEAEKAIVQEFLKTNHREYERVVDETMGAVHQASQSAAHTLEAMIVDIKEALADTSKFDKIQKEMPASLANSINLIQLANMKVEDLEHMFMPGFTSQQVLQGGFKENCPKFEKVMTPAAAKMTELVNLINATGLKEGPAVKAAAGSEKNAALKEKMEMAGRVLERSGGLMGEGLLQVMEKWQRAQLAAGTTWKLCRQLPKERLNKLTEGAPTGPSFASEKFEESGARATSGVFAAVVACVLASWAVRQ